MLEPVEIPEKLEESDQQLNEAPEIVITEPTTPLLGDEQPVEEEVSSSHEPVTVPTPSMPLHALEDEIRQVEQEEVKVVVEVSSSHEPAIELTSSTPLVDVENEKAVEEIEEIDINEKHEIKSTSSMPLLSLRAEERKREEDDPNAINHLGELLYHRLSTKENYTITKKDIAIWLSAASVGAMSLALYWYPTDEYAGDKIYHKVIYEFSTLFANFGLSTFAAKEAFSSFSSDLSRNMRNNINPDYHQSRFLSAMRIAGLSVVSVAASLPYALAAQKAWVAWLTAISNTIINYFAVNNVMFQDAKSLSHRFAPRQKKAYYKLLELLEHSVNKIIANSIREGKAPDKFQLNAIMASGPDEEIGSLSGQEIMQLLAKLADKYEVEAKKPMTSLQFFGRRVVPTAIGMGTVSGLVVYLLQAYINLHKYSEDETYFIPFTTAAISIPFLYLSFRFGAEFMIDIADYLTGNSEKSLARQLHPKANLAALCTIAVLVSGSYATIANFVNNDPYFQEGGSLSQFYTTVLSVASAGAFFINFIANYKLMKGNIESLSRLSGTNKALAHFCIEMKKFINNIKEDASPTVVLNSLQKLTREERLALLPTYAVDESVDQLIEEAVNGEEKDDSFLSRLNRSAINIVDKLYQNEEKEEEELSLLEYAKRPTHEQVEIARSRYGSISEAPKQDKGPGFFTRLRSHLPAFPRFGLGSYQKIEEEPVFDPKSVSHTF